MYDSIENRLKHGVWSSVKNSVWNSVENSVWGSVGISIVGSVGSSVRYYVKEELHGYDPFGDNHVR